MRGSFPWVSLGIGCGAIAVACGSTPKSSGFGPDGGISGDDGGSSSGGSGSGGGSSSGLLGDGSAGDGGFKGDPQTCDEAAQAHSYIGCDYWPTVVANQAWSIFDYAVVVANAGMSTANITVTGPKNTNQTATVGPGQLTTLYLPWVSVLKGPDQDNCTAGTPLTASVLASAAAYHLVSSVPVTVYQFSALEYQGQGGAPGKDWSTCPGNQMCPQALAAVGCYSFTNDASLLLPSSAMTGNYRVTGHAGWGTASFGAYFAITATQNNTNVNVKVSSTGQILVGGGVAATSAGGTLDLTMNAGDVAELVGPGSDQSDLSGSLVQASAPVQVITGIQCLDVPDNAQACDHVEESNFPAETLGKDYIVAQPASPSGKAVGQIVRIYGNFDGTQLAYAPAKPPGCPTTINAGQVIDCGGQGSQTPTAQDFEIKGDHSFAVGVFTQGASVVDPTTQPPNQQGDPDQSLATAVEQFRTKYVFLAPTDYEESFVVVIAPTGATVSIDGSPANATPMPVGSSGYGVMRVKLSGGQNGAHVLEASQPVGIQVMGYGAYTSYQYPGGLDLAAIAPPPPK